MSDMSYFCHQCNRSVGLRNSDLVCGSCGSEFIEEVRFEGGPAPRQPNVPVNDAAAGGAGGHGHSHVHFHHHPHPAHPHAHFHHAPHHFHLNPMAPPFGNRGPPLVPGQVHHRIINVQVPIGTLLNNLNNDQPQAQPGNDAGGARAEAAGNAPPAPEGQPQARPQQQGQGAHPPPQQGVGAQNVPNPLGDTIRSVFNLFSQLGPVRVAGGVPQAPQSAAQAGGAPAAGPGQPSAGQQPQPQGAQGGAAPPPGAADAAHSFEAALRNILNSALQPGNQDANVDMNLGNGIQFQIHLGGAEQMHGEPGDYVFGNMDRIVTQLMNQIGEHGGPVNRITDDDLRRLPMTTVKQKHVDNQVQCSTCFDNFNLDEPVAELCCHHIFHRPCLEPWLRQHTTCPVCRKDIDPKEWPAVSEDGASESQSNSSAGMMEPDLD